jgi:predicted amidohydrolase YtcJ
MEHLEFCDPADVPRLHQLGIVANMHFRHAMPYVDNAKDFLGDREAHSFCWRSFLDSGAIMATGSDYPVADFNPAPAIAQAVTRQLANGYPEGGWMPEQCVTVAEAIKAFTAGGAYAIGRDNDLGTLTAGKYADITVWDKNMFAIPKLEIYKVKPLLTLLAGKAVYEA